ncbi:MAG: hypothetical protein ACJAQ4_000343 [Cryomorphaceae bacterium]|jgi:hypothetical protein
MVVFPSPADDQLRIGFYNNENPSGKPYCIIDLSGRTLREGIYTNQINLEGLESGYYLLEVNGRVLNSLRNSSTIIH